MVELEHVLVADRNRTLERLAGASIVQSRLPGNRQIGQFEHAVYFLFLGTVENGGRHGNTVAQIAGQLEQVVIVE